MYRLTKDKFLSTSCLELVATDSPFSQKVNVLLALIGGMYGNSGIRELA
jgi:hypothetical protein